MGSELLVYLRLGMHHIADPKGYDHLLFVTALTAAYAPRQWRRLLWLVTAFTLGHSITLALATLNLVRVDARLVEILIPATIVITSLVAIAASRLEAVPSPPGVSRRWQLGHYGLAAGFGLIHGLGFSTFPRSLLGGEASIALPLFAFNVGLEAGQVMIVLAVLTAGAGVERIVRLTRREWVMVISGAAAGIATTMIVDRMGG